MVTVYYCMYVYTLVSKSLENMVESYSCICTLRSMASYTVCTVFSVQSKGIFNFSDHGTYCTSLGYKCVVTGDTGSV